MNINLRATKGWVVATHPTMFFCIMRLFHMENNFDILSTCRTFFGTHLVVEIVLVSHATKSYTGNSRDAGEWVVSIHPLVCRLYCVHFGMQEYITTAIL